MVEVGVPDPYRRTSNDLGLAFAIEDDHVGVVTYDDSLWQITPSHHWMEVKGHLVRHSAPYR